MADDNSDLPLFSGTHIPRIRFQNAIERLDLAAATVDAPDAMRADVQALAAALDGRAPARTDLKRLILCRRPGWDPALEVAWQRLVGLRLDASRVPGVLDGEPAAAFLLRGGDRDSAQSSLQRHLECHPRDTRAWTLVAEFEPIRGAARCAFHGGPVLDAAAPLVELVEEDELAPVGPWLLPYAWLTRGLGLHELLAAMQAEDYVDRPELPFQDNARAFTWHLLEAGGRPLGSDGSGGVVAARRRLQQISTAAFRRYMLRIATT